MSMSTANRRQSYYGEGQPPLQSGGWFRWGSSWAWLAPATPTYYAEPCGSGSHPYPMQAERLPAKAADDTPTASGCAVGVQAKEGAVVQGEPGRASPNECSAGPIAIVIPRST
jgi:hypothetical protein